MTLYTGTSGLLCPSLELFLVEIQLFGLVLLTFCQMLHAQSHHHHHMIEHEMV